MLFLLSLAFWGPRCARRKGKTTKITNPQGFVIFVVFSLLGAQVGKEKGTDNKNSKSLRVKG